MDSLKGRRILITGAGGFIGANLTRVLLQLGAMLHIIVRPETNPWRLKEVLPLLSLHSVDLLDASALQKAVHEIRPEHIIHLAVRRGVSSPQERLDTLQSNLIGLHNLLETTQTCDYRSFVYTGSSLEYGPRKSAHKETDRPRPTLFYGVTKAACMLLCQQYAQAAHLPIVMLRPFSVYGPWEDPGHLIPTAISRAFSGQELALTVPGLRRDLVFVEDVLAAYLLALQADRRAHGKIINIGSGQQCSNEALVEMIQSITGRPIRVRAGAFPVRPSDTTHWVADIRRAQRLLGWQPVHTLGAGLEKTVAWYRAHPQVYQEAARQAP